MTDTHDKAPTGNDAQAPYSLAFEKIVSGPDDIIGLIAYAKFKESIRQSAMSGLKIDRASRVPSPAEVKVYRSASEQLITQIVKDGIDAAAPEIQQTALIERLDSRCDELLSRLETHKSGIEKHVDSQTSFRSAFIAGMASWAASLFIIVIVYFLLGKPNSEETIVDSVLHPSATARHK